MASSRFCICSVNYIQGKCTTGTCLVPNRSTSITTAPLYRTRDFLQSHWRSAFPSCSRPVTLLSVFEVPKLTDSTLLSQLRRKPTSSQFECSTWLSRILDFRQAGLHNVPAFLSKCTNALVSISKLAKATLATQKGASFTRIEKANAKREVTVTKVTRWAAGIMMDRSIIYILSSFFQMLMKYHDGLDFLALHVRQPAILAWRTIQLCIPATTDDTRKDC